MGRGRALSLELGDARVAVRSDDERLLEWLAEALAPSFSVTAGGEDGVVVEVGSEPVKAGVRADRLLPCFALESQLVQMAAQVERGRIVLEDPDWGIRLALEPGRVRIWELEGHGILRSVVLRVVRELALTQALARGAMQLHASAVDVRGHGVAFAGPKEAGKTTTAAWIVACGIASLIANDRVLASRDEGRLLITGVPTLVVLRAGTIERLPAQFRTIPDVERPVRLTLDEYLAAGAVHGFIREPRQVPLSPPQLLHELGASASRRAPLECLALIELDPAAGEFDVEPRGREEAARAADAFSFGWPSRPSDRTVFDWVLNGGPIPGSPGPEPDAPNRVAPVELDGVRVVRLRVGPDFTRSPAAPRRLIRSLVPDR